VILRTRKRVSLASCAGAADKSGRALRWPVAGGDSQNREQGDENKKGTSSAWKSHHLTPTTLLSPRTLSAIANSVTTAIRQ